MRIVVLLRGPRVSPYAQEVLPGLAPSDRAALATALSLSAAFDGASVTALTAGPSAQDAALTAALAAGAHRALRIVDPIVSDSDLRTTASVISAGIHHTGYDLVLAGDRSADWSSGATGPAVAHLLGIPHVTSVISARRADDRIRLIHRRGRQTLPLLLTLPALITISAGPEPCKAAPADGAGGTGGAGSAGGTGGAGGAGKEIDRVSLADMTLPFRFAYDVDDLDLREITWQGEELDGVSSLLSIIAAER